MIKFDWFMPLELITKNMHPFIMYMYIAWIHYILVIYICAGTCMQVSYRLAIVNVGLYMSITCRRYSGYHKPASEHGYDMHVGYLLLVCNITSGLQVYWMQEKS